MPSPHHIAINKVFLGLNSIFQQLVDADPVGHSPPDWSPRWWWWFFSSNLWHFQIVEGDGLIKSAPGFSGLLGQVPQSHKVASHLSFKLWLALCFSRKIKLDILPQIGTNLLLRKLFVNRTFSFQISAFRASLTDVATYGHIPVPLVYTQVRNVKLSTAPHTS